MKKYRIKEELRNGISKFYPQERILFFFHHYLDGYRKEYAWQYFTKEEAVDEINRRVAYDERRKKNKTIYHKLYVTTNPVVSEDPIDNLIY